MYHTTKVKTTEIGLVVRDLGSMYEMISSNLNTIIVHQKYYQSTKKVYLNGVKQMVYLIFWV